MRRAAAPSLRADEYLIRRLVRSEPTSSILWAYFARQSSPVQTLSQELSYMPGVRIPSTACPHTREGGVRRMLLWSGGMRWRERGPMKSLRGP